MSTKNFYAFSYERLSPEQRTQLIKSAGLQLFFYEVRAEDGLMSIIASSIKEGFMATFVYTSPLSFNADNFLYLDDSDWALYELPEIVIIGEKITVERLIKKFDVTITMMASKVIEVEAEDSEKALSLAREKAEGGILFKGETPRYDYVVNESGRGLTYEEETLSIAAQKNIDGVFRKEVKKLLMSGGVNREQHNRAVLFAAALRRIADEQLPPYEQEDFKNLLTI